MTGGVRVAVLSSHAQLGGSERYLETLLPEIADLVVDVVALEDGPFVQRAGVPVHVLATGAGPAELLRSAWRLRRRLRAHGATVVHANGVKAALVAVLATLGSAHPRVLWLKHDFSWDGPLARAIAARCARVVGVSAAVVAGLPAARRDVVLTGIAPAPEVAEEQARLLLRRAAGVPADAPVALLVGRLHPVKGHLHAFEAVRRASEQVPGLHLAVVGDVDSSQQAYAQRVRAAADAHVTLLGARDDVRVLLAGADVVLVPSVVDERGMGREGFGMVPVEALAAGTPVVGYADGALPEVLGDCALLVAAGDHDALAAALVRVLQDAPLRQQLVACGRTRFAQAFGFDRMVRELRGRYAATAGSA